MYMYDERLPPFREGFYAVPQAYGSFFIVPQRYTRVQPIAAGRTFVAYAFDTVKSRPVIIKKVVLPDDFSDRVPWKRAQRELYCMMFIQHESIVQLYSCFTPSRTVEEMTEFYIVREFMPGHLKQIAPSSLHNHSTVKSVFFDICRGAQCLHTMNVSHRDLKPENCLVGGQNEVKLCDFGHANWDDPTANTPYVVQRYYRAPEIICETNDKNKTNVDIWSLGCIFAELLTGEVIFKGSDPVHQFVQIVQFLGNADPLFYEAMHRNARDCFRRLQLDRFQTPPGSLRDRFPDHYFQGGLKFEPQQCDLARDLLFKMLVINPDERINIQTVLTHPYFCEIWDENPQMQLESTFQPDQFLKTSFEFQNFVRPIDMKIEIFERIESFGRQYDIYTSSKN